MSEATLFEKIIAREIPAKIEHEDAHCIVIHDIDPQAPVHCLVIPKKPVPRIAEAEGGDQSTLGHRLLTPAQVAKKLDLAEGLRIVINNGSDDVETVPPLHVPLMGGRPLQCPPA